ncbi:OmpA family protein [Pseudoduganella lurida]|uniref:OmpA family protein n=1 Tax=Pseudoduganella lurida TaxID=1036180 RepID=UPI001315ACB1|nr:OmpA family protein [Pseudoduganella lurida]
MTPPFQIDIAFPFNAIHLTHAGRSALKAAVLRHPHAAIVITARADKRGTPAARQRVAAARARAIGQAVRHTLPAARITTEYDIAATSPQASTDRARQRRATVRFTASPTRP